jgi:hypothetical protein
MGREQTKNKIEDKLLGQNYKKKILASYYYKTSNSLKCGCSEAQSCIKNTPKSFGNAGLSSNPQERFNEHFEWSLKRLRH